MSDATLAKIQKDVRIIHGLCDCSTRAHDLLLPVCLPVPLPFPSHLFCPEVRQAGGRACYVPKLCPAQDRVRSVSAAVNNMASRQCCACSCSLFAVMLVLVLVQIIPPPSTLLCRFIGHITSCQDPFYQGSGGNNPWLTGGGGDGGCCTIS